MNKKLLTIFILGIFLFSLASVSAVNTNYDKNTRTVHFKTSFIGISTGDLADVQLITPLNYKVGLGYQKVAEMKVTGFKDYNDFVQQMQFYDTKQNMKEFTRDFDLKKKEIVQVSVNDYSYSNQTSRNGTIEQIRTLTGTHLENRETWTKLQRVDFKKNDVLTVAMFTNVKDGDRVEWIPTIAGKLIPEFAVWTADLNTNIVSYWKLDETAGTLSADSLNLHNGTIGSSAVYTASGQINGARDFDNTANSQITIPHDSSLNIGTGIQTYSVWIKQEATCGSSYCEIFQKGLSGNNPGMGIGIDSTNHINFWIEGTSEQTGISSNGTITNGVWTHLVSVIDVTSKTIDFYINGVINTEGSWIVNTGSVLPTQDLLIGQFNSVGGFGLNGVIDEPIIYNRALTSTEVLQIYNAQKDGLISGQYTTYFDQNTTVTAISPINNYNSTTSPTTQDFTCYGEDNINFTEMEFYWDGVLDQSNSTGLNATNYTFTKSGLTDGDYNWTCIGYDDEANTATFTARNYSVDTTPFIEFVSPTPANDSNINIDFLAVYTNISTPYFSNVTYYLDLENGTTLSQEYLTEIEFHNWTIPTTPEHIHIYTTVTTTTGQSNTTEVRHYNHDSTLPAINVTSPVSEELGVDNKTLNLNWTATDLNLDTCWYNYNSTNTTLTCSANTTTFNYVAGNDTLTFYANDTFGNLNSYQQNWNYNVTENAINYNSPIYETETKTISIDLTSESTINDVKLVYDGEEYITTNSGDTYSTTFDAKDTVGTYEFYFKTLIGSTYYNSTFYNQTVNPLFFGLCNATYTTQALHIFVKNEANESLIDSSLEMSGDIYLGSGNTMTNLTFSDTNNNKSDWEFCISPTDDTFYTNSVISYFNPTHERRESFLTNAEYNNVSQNLTLYLLPTVDTNIFTIKVIDDNENSLEGAYVRVQRWDVGSNNFYTVGTVLTASDGTGIIDLKLNDVWYRYVVIYNGEIVKTTEPVKEATTSRTIQVDLTAADNYDKFNNIDYSLTYNTTTQVASLVFADVTGSMAEGCLEVTEMNGLGKNQSYYSCIESTSGTLSYAIPYNGTFLIRATFILTSEYGSLEKIVDEIITNGEDLGFLIIGTAGRFASLLLIGTSGLIGVASGSIPLGLGLIVATMIIVNLIGWLNISAAVITSLISIIVLIIFNLGRKG